MERINQHIILEDNRKLGFAEYGSTQGYPIVYFHGSQSSRLEMHYDMSFAIENDIRVITIDRPGHGISDFNPKGSILEFAKDVKQLMNYLKIHKFSVAGMSAGSPFALGVSYLLPEKINKASIISGFAPFSKESKKHLSREVRLMLNLAKSFPFLFKFLLKIQARQIARNPKKVLQGFLKAMSEADQRILKNNSVRNIIESMFQEAFRNGSDGVAYEISNILVKNWRVELDGIRVPVTFWHGEEDKNAPLEWSELMIKKINQAKLKKYPNEGHLILFKHVNEIFADLKANIGKPKLR